RAASAVGDTGRALRPPVQEGMFEPFFTTKEVGKGSGMGLSTVHGIVHEHGGHIVVESVPGRGATFRVMLPALSSPAGAVLRNGAVASDQLPSAAFAGHVAVGEDEASVGRFMQDLLGHWGLTLSSFTYRRESARTGTA